METVKEETIVKAYTARS